MIKWYITINDLTKKNNILNKVKAFIPVHLNGQCSDLKIIQSICEKHKIKIIEDSCHALGTKYKPLNSKKIYKIGDCNYSDISIPAVVSMNNIFGCQFHPEKSGEDGLIFLKNFCEIWSIKKKYQYLILY